jgi:hypothetical protein
MPGIRYSLPVALLLLACTAQDSQARVLEAGPNRTYKLPSEAIAAAHDGDTVRIDAGEYFDCATVRTNLTIEGVGPNGSTVLTDKTCGGKALLVAAGADITIRNMTLTRARVPDMNGAGIRAEGGHLTVERVRFINNQNGILSAANPEGSIVVRDSEFTRNGLCSPSCAHGIYAGQVGLLRVERTKFLETKEAHHIKSRALRTEVIGCDIRDGETGTASYMIEVANGGSLLVRDSTLVKGPQAENHTGAIMIGTEGVTQPTREILIENNTFRNEGDYNTFFVVNLTATEAMLKGNKISGNAKPLRGDGQVR